MVLVSVKPFIKWAPAYFYWFVPKKCMTRKLFMQRGWVGGGLTKELCWFGIPSNWCLSWVHDLCTSRPNICVVWTSKTWPTHTFSFNIGKLSSKNKILFAHCSCILTDQVEVVACKTCWRSLIISSEGQYKCTGWNGHDTSTCIGHLLINCSSLSVIKSWVETHMKNVEEGESINNCGAGGMQFCLILCPSLRAHTFSPNLSCKNFWI